MLSHQQNALYNTDSSTPSPNIKQYNKISTLSPPLVHYILCPKKVSPLNILQQPPQTCTDLNDDYTHKTTSIFVIDVKFHKNLLFRLRDVQFFQTAVTNLSYRYNLLLADVICGDRCDVSAC